MCNDHFPTDKGVRSGVAAVFYVTAVAVPEGNGSGFILVLVWGFFINWHYTVLSRGPRP
jgi:hypothetical protein